MKNIMKKFKGKTVKDILVFTLTLTIMLTGLAAAGVDVEISSYPSQITVDESANISVQVLDNFTPQNNTLINFTTTLGSLGKTSIYTNSSGMATTSINSTVSGVATINASVGGGSTNVTFLPGKPAFIDVNITQSPLVVGNTTVVNLSVYDQYNNANSTANMTLNIQIFDILGETINQVNITRASFELTQLVADQSGVTLVNSTFNSSSILLNIDSTVAGNITITAKAGNITNTFNITFTPAALSYLSVDYYKECTVNTSSIITVGAWDMYDNPIKDAVVIFNATPPPVTKYNSPIEYNSLNLIPEINITNLNGFTSTVFRADKRAGENIINITVGNINTIITIEGIADDATEILLSHTPDVVYANNKGAYRLTAQVVDKFLNPVFPKSVPITKQVLFTTSLGSVIMPLNNSGGAVTIIGPTPFVETVTVTARYEDETGPTNITGSINLSFVEGNQNRIVIYSSPDTVLSQNIRGNHNASITLTSLDEWGHPIPGINVTLNNTTPSLGNLTVAGINDTDIINSTINSTINLTTDTNGMIRAVFTSKTLVGNATIIASSGTINSFVNISIKDVPFLSVNITFEPASINSGGNVNVTTIISVEGELPISRPAANAMLVLDTSGSMDPDYYAGTPLDIMLLSDTSGSMDEYIVNTTKKIDAVKTAAKQFNSNMISNDRVGLLTFSETTAKLYDLTYDMTNINQKIDAQSASGGTPTALAIRNAANYLKNNTRLGARPYIILLSDGLPTYDLKGNYCDDSYPSCSSPTYDALKEANIAKTTFTNNNSFIKIYTIGFGKDADNATMSAIASPNSYYYAATPSQLQDIYNNIAKQISDFDITTRQYGTDGFTSYSYAANGIVNSTVNWTDTIPLNDIVTDFKVFIDNVNLNFTLTSPSGIKYPKSTESGFVNRTGYYNSGIGKYVWIAPVSGIYDPVEDNNNTILTGNWIISVNGSGAFNITTYIDKKSSVKLASRSFVSSFDPNRGDRVGLVAYSSDPNPPNITNNGNQTSYIRNGSTWVGYFTGGNTVSTSWAVKYPSSGNYPNNQNLAWNKTVPGASQIRAHFTKIDVEGDHDFVNISDGKNNLIASYTNYGPWPGASISDVWSPWINGDTIKIRFTSDASYRLSGFQTDTVETLTNYTFNLTWPNVDDKLALYLFQGATLINQSGGHSGFETLSAPIYIGTDYNIEVDGTNISSETLFNVATSQNLNWKQYSGRVTSTLNDSYPTLDRLNNSIDTITSIGLTAIDEGLYQANNELSNVSGNSTIVLMTDGLDNAGYHSMLLEVQSAKKHNTTIYTIGFGTNESEVDLGLSDIANITGGQYYFAPNTSVLQNIFRGIASNITNFSVHGPTLNLQIPHNYVTGLSLATATYISNSSNTSTNIGTNFTAPTYPAKGNAEPNVTTEGNVSTLSWTLPSLNPGEKWGVWYQLAVQGAGYVPLILPTSNISYTDLNGTFITVNIIWSGGANLGGGGAGVNYIALGNVQLSANPPVVFTGEPSNIIVTATYVDGNPAIANVTLFTDLGYFNNLQNPLDGMTVSGSGFANFVSTTAGQALIKVIGSNGNNSVMGSVVIVVKPKGKIIVS